MGIQINISEEAVKLAAKKGDEAFVSLFTDEYRKVLNGPNGDSKIQELNEYQYFLLEFSIFKSEMDEGGFLQLIQNGYGPYVFRNPFAKYMRLMGVDGLSKLIYKAQKIYDTNKDDLETERTQEDFLAMYEQYDNMNELDDEFVTHEEKYVSTLAHYIDEHITDFANIIK